MRRDRETILKTFLGTLFVFGFVSSLHAQCSNLEKQTGDGTLFIVEVEADKVTGVRATEEAIKVLEARLKGIGAKGKVSKSIDKADRIEVKVFGTQDIEKLRGLFINHQLEIRAVVSPPNPNPYKSFRNFAEAINDIGEGQEVRPYTRRDGEDEHFVILEREAIVNGKDIRKAEAFSRTGFDDDNQIAFSLAPRGAAALSEWTGKNINKYIAVMLDDKVVSISYIKSQVSDEGEISGRFTKTEAEAIASSLQSGFFPGTLKIISERSLKRP